MNDDPTDFRANFRDRLLAVEPLSVDSANQIEEELHAMFVRELTLPRRISFGIIAVVALSSALVCAFLSLTVPELPLLARIGLGTGSLFGVAWMAVAVRICKRGAIDMKLDSRRIAAMTWVFTVLMMVYFLMVGMSIEDRLLGLLMVTNGFAFLMPWSSHAEGVESGTLTFHADVDLRDAWLFSIPFQVAVVNTPYPRLRGVIRCSHPLRPLSAVLGATFRGCL